MILAQMLMPWNIKGKIVSDNWKYYSIDYYIVAGHIFPDSVI